MAAIKDVTIICPIHGEFQQRPANHNIGRGCRACGGSKPLSITNFIIRAQIKHRNRYDYALVDFKSVEDKVRIICPEHGIFSQRVMTHLKGFNCPSCGRESTAQKLSHSLERFLQDAKSMHGDRYEYSEVDYTNALSKVKIICRAHGPFFQLPAAHCSSIILAMNSLATLSTLPKFLSSSLSLPNGLALTRYQLSAILKSS